MGAYLCYDIRGIQSFIFRIPKLKYIIGGSALIDQFDRDTAPDLAENGVEYLYSGGGKGAYKCDDGAASELQKKLIAEAHEVGLDIRFGISEDFTEASLKAVELYPFVPQPLEGVPCPQSGLYPVSVAIEEHPVVRKRIFHKGKPTFRHFDNRLAPRNVLIPGIDPEKHTFFRNVNANDCDDTESGRLGARALGGRNRWAVICMDGNDMGSQFNAMTELKDRPEEEMTTWIREMSIALDECTEHATKAGIQRVVSEWAGTPDFNPKQEERQVVLPVRPIVVGGDDIIVICHVAHAMTFVKEAMREFRGKSIELQKEAGIELWPATGGKVSISAGVLYCPVTLPLHTAVNYAESLLASAKAEGRRKRSTNSAEPSPESIDWEQITDSIVDNPTARRQRELIFTDADNGGVEVRLTARPYTLDRFNEIERLSEEKYKKLPVSICQSVLKGLRQGFSDRLAFVAEIAKHQPELAADITEKGFEIGKKEPRWKYAKEDNSQETDVVDALLLLEERHRMRKETING